MTADLDRTEDPGVQIRDLTVSLAGTDVPVVCDISLEIAPGEILGLVGESGSGKSTVGLALLAYARRGLSITSGSVHVSDTDMLALSRADVESARGRVVAYVPQDPGSALNPARRIGAQMREALMVHRQAMPDVDIEAHVCELLGDVALPETVLDRYPHQLSGGQQQRVAIAIAFSCRPRLVVLDEPTTGLDVTTQSRILETTRELADAYHASALYVSHDLPAVSQIADSVAVMYAGRIVERGATTELFRSPRHPYTGGLLQAAPFPGRATRLVGIDGQPPRPGSWPDGCSFANRCSRATDTCRASAPELVETQPGTEVRCFHALAESHTSAPAVELAPAVSAQAGAALSVRGLIAKYGGAPVVHGVSLEVPAGLCTAIVGESGSGKTTIARCVAGLHRAWDGEIKLGDTPLARAAAKRGADQLKRMQYVFQNPYTSLNPTLTVVENIEEPLRHFEDLRATERRQRALEALDTVALTRTVADRVPAKLSGGERQRVAVARALVVNPEILICDEITSALDVSVQAVLVEQLRNLQAERHLTMLFITHNLALVRSLAQHIVVLERGEVVEHGTTESVLDNPQHEYTQRLLSDVPHLIDAAGARSPQPRTLVGG